ncbi:MAG: FHA domain-containing protein [Deltaproteobacteria bacterium]|nr:FHA domain-containing protein [Deltaproteobacteria bacterium]
MAQLLIISSEGHQRFVSIEGHSTLGRHPDNTIQLLDRIVSKNHCHIDQVADGYVLKDMGSLNGTFINGQRLNGEIKLKSGDEITVGSTRIIFEGTPEKSKDGVAVAESILGRVTISPGMVESHIRSKLAAQFKQSFIPEHLVGDTSQLRRDYEKLRISYELVRAIGVELDGQKVLQKILACAFELLSADRGVVLLFDHKGELSPRCVRTAKGEDNEEVILSSTIINMVVRDRSAVLSSDASMDARFKSAHSVIMQGIRSSMAVPLIHSDELLGVMVLDTQVATNAFTEKDLQLTQVLANQAAVAIQNSIYAKKIEEEALTRERFQRLLSPAIAELVVSGEVEVAKGGQLRQITVFFSDIRGFTSMSEKSSAQDIVTMLNEYFELMVEVIFKYEGTLDKFVGDEIMALFGAPVTHPDDAYRAVKVAVEQMRVLDEFNRTRVSEGEAPVKIGIGINSGDVVAGYLGSSRALEYTVIGDTVNIASRLCSCANAGEIIISKNTYEHVKDYFKVEELPPTQVKGIAKPLKIYRVIEEKGDPPRTIVRV